MKRKIANWILAYASKNRQEAGLIAFAFVLIARLGFLKEESHQGNFVYFTCFLDNKIAIRLNKKTSAITIWWGEDDWHFEPGNVDLLTAFHCHALEASLVKVIKSFTPLHEQSR